MKTLAVYCGRFNPVHAGHEAVINTMIEQFGIENIIVIIGSSNTAQSLRHFFHTMNVKILFRNCIQVLLL